jgi:hypothetical protein
MGLRLGSIRLALATLLAGVLTALAACSAASQPAASHASSGRATGPAANTAAAGGNCSPATPTTPLPVWARAGFTPPGQAVPHVMGISGGIVAILWARKDALIAPSLPDRGNKILWVSRLPLVPLSPLRIRATLVSSGLTVTREVTGGPGPSIIDMPAAGCWIFALSWSGHSDQVRLRYAPAHVQ